MHLALRIPAVYSALAVAVLVMHALFIVWVVFGSLIARHRRWLQWLHIASLTWGLVTESLPVPCPLTLVEDWLELKAGTTPEQGGFLLRYMDKLVYPDVASVVLMTAAVSVVAVNFFYYGWQAWNARSGRLSRPSRPSSSPW